MKIQKFALFLPSLTGGGAERIFVTLANSFVARGIHIDLVLANAFGNYFSLLDKKINVINLQSSSVFFSLFKLIKYLRTEKPDILLSAVENANTLAIIAKKLSATSIPIIITEHSNWSQVLSNQPPLKEKMLFQISRNVYPLADKVVTVSNGIRTELLKTINLDPQQVVCIYNPVIPRNLPILAEMQVVHPWLSNKEWPVIISVGRLAKEKDFKTLILAYQNAKKLKYCRLIILGEGPERKNLQATIHRLGLQNDIDLPGFVENPFAWISKSDLFVLSSLYEGLPTVLIEAMACGTPVISTDCISGPAEILENGKFGDLVPVGNADALAAAIVKNLSTAQSNVNLKLRANAFSIDSATDAYQELIQQVLGSE